ncbi:MAG: hypothetical protein Q3Y08_10835 [Butyricicoccus sp.]|nr:hypothetical protein [Butyricicoccus sp.]
MIIFIIPAATLGSLLFGLLFGGFILSSGTFLFWLVPAAIMAMIATGLWLWSFANNEEHSLTWILHLLILACVIALGIWVDSAHIAISQMKPYLIVLGVLLGLEVVGLILSHFTVFWGITLPVAAVLFCYFCLQIIGTDLNKADVNTWKGDVTEYVVLQDNVPVYDKKQNQIGTVSTGDVLPAYPKYDKTKIRLSAENGSKMGSRVGIRFEDQKAFIYSDVDVNGTLKHSCEETKWETYRESHYGFFPSFVLDFAQKVNQDHPTFPW